MAFDDDSSSSEALILSALKDRARSMSGWLKVLGVAYILSGIPSLIVLVGALNIWLGVLLFQAGSAAQEGDDHALLRMMSKFKTFFIVNAVLILIGIAIFALVLLSVGTAALIPFMEQGNGFQV